jgi:hypothetical protein
MTIGYLANLTRSGQKDGLYKEMNERLQLPWIRTLEEKNREMLIAESRHLFTHNSGLISAQFVNKVASFSKFTPADVGKPLELGTDTLIPDLQFLHEIVKRVDDTAIMLYTLPTNPLLPEPATTGSIYDHSSSDGGNYTDSYQEEADESNTEAEQPTTPPDVSPLGSR